MNIEYILGNIMILAPFVAMFIFIVCKDGWKVALVIFGACFGLLGWLAAAAFLINN